MEKEATVTEMEDVLEACGGFGKFQLMVMFGIFIHIITASWGMLAMSFAGYIPHWYCVIIENEEAFNGSGILIMNNDTFEKCSLNNSETGNAQQECRNYHFVGPTRTVITEWDLLCDLSWVKATITSIQMCGVLLGAFLAGQFADRFGRKKTLFGFSLLHTVLNFCAAFSVSWEMFAVLRFFLGFGIAGILVVTYPYAIEFLPTKWRPLVGVMPNWPVGVSLFALVSFLSEDWTYVHIACGAFGIPSAMCYFFVPESPRWLTIKGRHEEAEDVFGKMAAMNGGQLPAQTKAVLEKVHLRDMEKRAAGNDYSYLDLFKSWSMAKLTLIFMYLWFMSSVVYYGISFGVSALSGNLYLNIFLLTVVELPSLFCTFHLSNKLGRKGASIFLLIIGGIPSIGCLVVEFVSSGDSKGPWITGMSLTGRFGLSAAWIVTATWCNELFPTVIRNLGYGMANVAARIGGIAAPFLVDLDNHEVRSYAIISVMVIVALVLSLIVPETKGMILSDTIDDIPEENKPTKKYDNTSNTNTGNGLKMDDAARSNSGGDKNNEINGFVTRF